MRCFVDDLWFDSSSEDERKHQLNKIVVPLSSAFPEVSFERRHRAAIQADCGDSSCAFAIVELQEVLYSLWRGHWSLLAARFGLRPGDLSIVWFALIGARQCPDLDVARRLAAAFAKDGGILFRGEVKAFPPQGSSY